MERTDSECSLPCSQETYDYLVGMVTKDASLSQVYSNSLGAKFDSDPEDQCSITVQKVPLMTRNEAMTTQFIEANKPPPRDCISLSTLMPTNISTLTAEDRPLSLPVVPSNTEYAGNYKFAIEFDSVSKPLPKSTPWVYSKELNKLFVKKDTPCPIRFKTEGQPPSGAYIRALMLFCRMEDINEVVCSCPADATRNVQGYKDPTHVVHCTTQDAIYEKCPKTGRLSVRFSLDKPQAGTDCFVKMMRFGCYTSCSGGMNRRPTQIIFTLEYLGQTLGRRKVDVRICACPGRDLSNAEAVQQKIKEYEVLTKEEEIDANASTDELSSEEDQKKGSSVQMGPQPFPLLKRKSSGNVSMTLDISRVGVKEFDDELFALVVRGRENFGILSKLKEALELRDNLSPDVVHDSLCKMPPSGPLRDFLNVSRTDMENIENHTKKRKIERTQSTVSDQPLSRSSQTETGNLEYERCFVTRTVSLDKLERERTNQLKLEDDE